MRRTLTSPSRLRRYRFDAPASGSPSVWLRASLRGHLATAAIGDECETQPVRYQVRIDAEGSATGTIVAILSRHGGVCVDSARDIYDFPTHASFHAALIAARSIHGWASVKPWY